MNAKTFSMLAAAALLAGCVSYGGASLRPGASTEAEVRSVMGEPGLVIPESDGSKRLVYPRGPLGTQTFMVDVGRDGVLKAVQPVLNDGVFNAIRPGWTRDQILHAIGPPGDTMHFARSDTTAWDYKYRDTWGYTAIFSVPFDRDGIVVSKLSTRIERDDGRN